MAGQDLVPYDADKLKRDSARVEGGFLNKLRRSVRRLPFIEDLVAAYYCAVDPATPMQVKAVLFGALACFVLPVDLLPDFIAWFGFTDDAAVLYAAIRAVAPHIKDAHREQAKDAIDRLASGAPKSPGA